MDVTQKASKGRVALCCIAKDEDRYIDEWIQYHLRLGFDTIFVFRDNWDWQGRSKYNQGVVSGNAVRGENPQVPTYNYFLSTYGEYYEWVLFIDVDEFLVLKKHDNVKSYLEAHSGDESIGVNWVLFGSREFDHGDESGQKRGVRDRFRWRQSGVNHHVKCFLRCGNESRMLNPHFGNKEWRGSDSLHHWGSFLLDGNDDEAYVAHYFCKTWAEWCVKRDRGRPDTKEKRGDVDFFRHDLNHEYEYQPRYKTTI